jgi:cysteine desulfurase / selenocysteine lyase
MSRGPLLSSTLRGDFPLLTRKHASGRPLIYLDSAATSLKPREVIDAVTEVLSQQTANVHRAVHMLGDEATESFEKARRKIARLIGAETHEVVLLRNTTEALNLVARCYPRKGSVLVSLGEHHSNLLPWDRQKVTHLPPGADGGPDHAAILRELDHGGVSVVTIAQISNVTGAHTDVAALARAAHAAGAILVVDAAQSVPHMPIDVQELDCDFLAFSGHKMCGPTGVGVLYGKAERLAEIEWYLLGGGTVEEVASGVPKAKQAPWRFEAGTPAIEATVGLGAAVDYLQCIGLDNVEVHCRQLRDAAYSRLRSIPGVRVLGDQSACRASIGPISFTVTGVLSHMLARGLSDAWGICDPVTTALNLCTSTSGRHRVCGCRSHCTIGQRRSSISSKQWIRAASRRYLPERILIWEDQHESVAT